jgi:hypothetical protein
MREALGPWLYVQVTVVSLGATHSIVGTGPKVGEWLLIPGHLGDPTGSMYAACVS